MAQRIVSSRVTPPEIASRKKHDNHEFKWNRRKTGVNFPKTFTRAYPEAQTCTITPENYGEFLTE
jgi:hypothetical protein